MTDMTRGILTPSDKKVSSDASLVSARLDTSVNLVTLRAGSSDSSAACDLHTRTNVVIFH